MKIRKQDHIRSTYLQTLLTPNSLKKNIAKVVKRLRELPKNYFDSIAFRGMSGAIVAPMVASRLHKHIILVRKQEQCHSSYQVEGSNQLRKYIIIDDMVSSGSTLDNIQRFVNDALHSDARCVGICLYNESEGIRATVDYFRKNKDVQWLRFGSKQDQIDQAIDFMRDKADGCLWHNFKAIVFGPDYKDKDYRSALDVLFPHAEERKVLINYEKETKHILSVLNTSYPEVSSIELTPLYEKFLAGN